MIRRYLVVSRPRGYRRWNVQADHIQLLPTALRQARDYAAAHPGQRVQVWVDISQTKVVKKIQ
jgi:hypothetical protein